MSRFAAPAVGLLLLALLFVPVAEATHQWGHRYMIYGRILDADGDPVQHRPVAITVDTTKKTDPRMTVLTDCDGLYYSYKENANPAEGDLGLEGGVMHIHKWELPSSGKWKVSTEFGSKRGQVRPEMHRSTVNLQVDEDVPAAPECPAGTDWRKTYVVEGRLQEIDGKNRLDKMTMSGGGLEYRVFATIETTNGTMTANGTTNRFGDFMITFQNVTVKEGGEVTAEWGGKTQTGRINTKYMMTEANVIYGESGASLLFLWILLGVVVAGAAVWGVSRAKGMIETSRLEKVSTRKRANR